MTERLRIFEGVLDNLLAEGAKGLVDDALDEGVAAAQRLVPVDTGELRDGIHVVEGAHEDGGGVVGTYGVTDVEHALPVEFGTERAAAQPYLRPSIDAAKQALR